MPITKMKPMKKQSYNVTRAYIPPGKTYSTNGKREVARRLSQVLNGQVEFWSSQYFCLCKYRITFQDRWYIATKPYSGSGVRHIKY